ncbi:MAG TPA: site-specific integrase [Thiobacillus sp.]|nr:site-specific integrase [Thiobacillus sp.]
MATIRKRGELQWQAIVKRKGFPGQSKTWNTRKEAEAWARQIESEMDRGVFVSRVESERVTLAEIIERYREDELPKKRGKGFGPALNALESRLGKYSLAALSSKLITDYRKKRLVSVSADTVRKEINLLSKLIDLAGKEWGMPLPSNPCAMVSRPAAGKARERRLEGDELERLLAKCEPHMQALIQFAIETAARLGELLSVKWVDVDLKRRVMIVRGIDERGTKNDDAFRAVPLSSAAIEVLKAIPRSIKDGRVFYQWKAADSFNKSWTRAKTRAQIQYLKDEGKWHLIPMEYSQADIDRHVDGFLSDMRFHDLRHEATSRLFEKNVFDSMEVASITGHKTLQMLKRYTHLRAEDLAKKLG